MAVCDAVFFEGVVKYLAKGCCVLDKGIFIPVIGHTFTLESTPSFTIIGREMSKDLSTSTTVPAQFMKLLKSFFQSGV